MDDQTVTLALDGEVTLDDFATSMQRFEALLGSLSRDVAGDDHIEWVIASLSASSAVATVQGTGTTEVSVARVVRAYSQLGTALEEGAELPFSRQVRRHAADLTSVIDHRIKRIRLGTARHQSIVTAPVALMRPPTRSTTAYGTVKGTVETLIMRGGLRFTLYDVLFDRPVVCHLSEDQQEQMRAAWGKRVAVSGRVTRENGHPVSVKDVMDIRVIKDAAPGSYTRAEGVIEWQHPHGRPEQAIRILREESDPPDTAKKVHDGPR